MYVYLDREVNDGMYVHVYYVYLRSVKVNVNTNIYV